MNSWPNWGKATGFLISTLLFAIAFLVYSPLLEPAYGFILFDDPMYVSNNILVRGGFTGANLWAAFSEPQVGNYHPFAMLSLMLDYQLGGHSALMFHFTSILFHSLNTVLVFWVLVQMTGAKWRSFLVSLLFAVHPSRVESVAWVSERKDVLFLFFWLLATIAYVKWAKDKKRGAYIACILFFLASLMSKPMAVTFPFALLVLDFWPLGRMNAASLREFLGTAIRLVFEKLPLFLLTGAFCFLTMWAQQGAIATPELVSKLSTATNAVVAYSMYFAKTLFPTEQAIFYPYRPLSGWTIACALSLVVAITGFGLHQAKSRPYILSCWLLFLGTLVPVIGLVQVGAQAMADRYLYLPGLPILCLLVWAGADLASRSRGAARVIQGVFAAAVVIFSSLTLDYLSKWRNTETLFNHALAVTGENSFPHLGLASWHMSRGDYRNAATHYAAFLKAELAEAGPETAQVDRSTIWGNLGYSVAKLEDWESAKRFTETALRIDLNLGNAWWNLYVINTRLGLDEEAANAKHRYQRLKPAEGERALEVIPMPVD